MSDSESGPSEINTPPRKVAKTWYNQHFNSKWLEEPGFSEWLQEDESEKGESYCKCCKMQLHHANKSMLTRHQNTAKHQKALKSSKSTTNLGQFVAKRAHMINEKEEAAKAELTLAAFMSEHNMPFSHCDHLVKVCKKAFHDSKIAKQVSMGATKASYIIQDGIAYNESESISEMCRNNKFSLIIDESTDISVSQILAIVVRLFDPKKK